mmetsp:Transcript_32533/g.40315  ORF Transcript_32533/g.40315 Transcript_32533/m.40315 type:complete len:145 (+) Transcript_32533:3-437(+)
MPNRCTKFLRGQDALGSNVMLNYKGEGGYGTILGGCMSIIVNTFSFFFIIMQLYAWFFKPSFNKTAATNYLSRKTSELYTIPLTSFLPTFGIISFGEDGKTTTNDASLVKWGWKFEGIEDHDEIESILCKDLVNSWTQLSTGER